MPIYHRDPGIRSPLSVPDAPDFNFETHDSEHFGDEVNLKVLGLGDYPNFNAALQAPGFWLNPWGNVTSSASFTATSGAVYFKHGGIVNGPLTVTSFMHSTGSGSNTGITFRWALYDTDPDTGLPMNLRHILATQSAPASSTTHVVDISGDLVIDSGLWWLAFVTTGGGGSIQGNAGAMSTVAKGYNTDSAFDATFDMAGTGSTQAFDLLPTISIIGFITTGHTSNFPATAGDYTADPTSGLALLNAGTAPCIWLRCV